MIQASEGNTSAVKTRNVTFIISKSLLHCIKLARSETRGKTQLLWEISVNLNMCVHTKCQQMLMDSKQWIQSLWACRGYELSLLWQVLPFHQNLSAMLVHLLKTAQLLYSMDAWSVWPTRDFCLFCLFQMSTSCCWNMQQQHPSLTLSIKHTHC